MNLTHLLDQAIALRSHKFDTAHESAFRLFNGFYEGAPNFVVDIYARTLLIHNYADQPAEQKNIVEEITRHLQSKLNWLSAGVLKIRNSKDQNEKRGTMIFGTQPDKKIREHGVWYAVDLLMNRDASFYLDTFLLRKWLIENMQGKSVLNTFAYTGSLGVAAKAAHASEVIQTDLNRMFLNLAKDSYSLNGFAIQKKDFLAQDFFPAIAKLKSEQRAFDCVIIDPPFFSTTERGRVDQVHDSARIINKVRPLIRDGGVLIAINNALFVSGEEYMRALDTLCKDGYLKIRELIPVPDDFIGNTTTPSVTNPAPFNHSTKIAILDVKKKVTAM